MTTRIDMQCPHCNHIEEIVKKLAETPVVHCPSCGEIMRVYFGNISAIPINYGFREDRYRTNTDRDIAKFQFTHL